MMRLRLNRPAAVLCNLVILTTFIFLIADEIYEIGFPFRDGGYDSWTSFTECSRTCGGGIQHRKRSCINPLPTVGGRNCSFLGPGFESRICNARPCAVDGGFEPWSLFGPCSKSCEGGVQSRGRYCNSPPPQYGGKDCGRLGAYTETLECNAQKCPVNGGFSEWNDWSGCTVTCDSGTRQRSRSCTNPTPSDGGSDCEGEYEESESCATEKCPVNGVYSDWGEWGRCSAECDGGIKERRRTCDSPAPKNGGRDCTYHGNPEEVVKCNKQPCSQDGGYSDWNNWSKCSKSCEGGTSTRKRLCDSPSPIGSGKSCSELKLGASTEIVDCNSNACPTQQTSS